MKSFIFFFLFAFSRAQAIECNRPITQHLDEAIAHNKNMVQTYADLSDGRSKKISYTLINLERLSKLIVSGVESEADIYHKRNIPLLCEEIPSMHELPEFQARLPEELRPQFFFQYDRKTLSHSLKKLMKKNRFNEAYELVSKDLTKLEEAPNQQCMTRHFLESIAITLKLADSHRLEAQAAGLPDPLNLIKKYIELQRQALLLTAYLDKQAFPFQKDGLLIFCQDVPAINWR